MYYELYIDVFFFTNFMMDSLMLFAVRAMLKIPVKGWRLFLGGALASLAACVAVAVPFPQILKYIVFYALLPLFMIRAGLGVRQFGEFARAVGLLYVSAFLWGGIQTALRPYVRTAGIFFAVTVISYYVFTFCWQFAMSVWKRQQKICEVHLFVGERQIVRKALLDTGNVLTDPISGELVSVIDKETAEKIFYGAEGWKTAGMGLRYIPYRSVGGAGVLPIVRIDKMCVKMEKDEWIMCPILGISGQKLEERQEYQMVLNPDIIGNIHSRRSKTCL